MCRCRHQTIKNGRARSKKPIHQPLKANIRNFEKQESDLLIIPEVYENLRKSPHDGQNNTKYLGEIRRKSEDSIKKL